MDTDAESLPEEERVAIPTQPPPGPDDFVMDLDTWGVLEGDADIDGACLWINEVGVETLPVRWPHGYSAAFDPPRLLDPDGRVVATQGERVWVAGGFSQTLPEIMDRCTLGADRFWDADDAQPLAEGQEHPPHRHPVRSDPLRSMGVARQLSMRAFALINSSNHRVHRCGDDRFRASSSHIRYVEGALDVQVWTD